MILYLSEFVVTGDNRFFFEALKMRKKIKENSKGKYLLAEMGLNHDNALAILNVFMVLHTVGHIFYEHTTDPRKYEPLYKETPYFEKYTISQLHEFQADMFAAQHLAGNLNTYLGTKNVMTTNLSWTVTCLSYLFSFYDICDNVRNRMGLDDSDNVHPLTSDRWKEVKWAIYGSDETISKHTNDDVFMATETSCNTMLNFLKDRVFPSLNSPAGVL